MHQGVPEIMAAEMSLGRLLSRRSFSCRAAAAVAAASWLPSSARAAAEERPDDLIGEITVYLTRGDETLLDVARERNLGVPEVSAVNPGIDPWIPGAETLVTLPTQFILPDAPREGIVVN